MITSFFSWSPVLKFWLSLTHYGSPHIMGVHTLWESTHYGSPHIMGVHTLWESTYYESPHIMGVHTLWESTHYGSPHIMRVHTLWESTYNESPHIMRVHTLWDIKVLVFIINSSKPHSQMKRYYLFVYKELKDTMYEIRIEETTSVAWKYGNNQNVLVRPMGIQILSSHSSNEIYMYLGLTQSGTSYKRNHIEGWS